MMVEQEVITCLNKILLTSAPKFDWIIENQNHVHPMNQTFGLVGEWDTIKLGTPTKTLTSRTGVWVMQQSYAYDVKIGVQGYKKKDIGGIVRELMSLLEIPPIRQIFADSGFNYSVNPKITSQVYQLNTDQYIRHSFDMRFTRSITTPFKQDSIKAVDVKGEFSYEKGNVIETWEEGIEPPE